MCWKNRTRVDSLDRADGSKKRRLLLYYFILVLFCFISLMGWVLFVSLARASLLVESIAADPFASGCWRLLLFGDATCFGVFLCVKEEDNFM